MRFYVSLSARGSYAQEIASHFPFSFSVSYFSFSPCLERFTRRKPRCDIKKTYVWFRNIYIYFFFCLFSFLSIHDFRWANSTLAYNENRREIICPWIFHTQVFSPQFLRPSPFDPGFPEKVGETRYAAVSHAK